MKSVDFNNFQSPFSWRYASDEMREIFSEVNRRKTWRRVWVALAKAQQKAGLISSAELTDIIKHSQNIDIETAHKIEQDIKHDLMAELKTFSSQAKIGGGKIHLGATSQDIEDNADIVIFLEALEKIEKDINKLLKVFSRKIEANKDLVCMAYTHLQPAEPTTLGYRFSVYAQDLLLDLELLSLVKKNLKGKGTKGAVGTYASYVSLLSQKAKSMEADVLDDLKISAFDVTGQVYPRKIDFWLLSLFASIAQSTYKFAFDVRIMQSSGFGEWMEPFGSKQVGSSAMPFKRNPIISEKICSLSRFVSNLSKNAWDYAANSLLERTLDDSASRRIIIPESFLAIDEILISTTSVIEGLVINQKNIQKNLENFGPFSSLEQVLLQSTKKGANRQDVHEILRGHAMIAYQSIESGNANPLFDNLKKDEKILKFLNVQELEELSNYKKHIGLVSEKSALIMEKIRKINS